MTLEERYKYLGAVASEPDPRNVQFAAVSAKTGKKRPKKCITDISMLAVEDQKQIPSCVGNAEGKVPEYFEYVETGKLKRLSKRWLYARCKQLDGFPKVDGTMPAVASKVLSDEGVPGVNFAPDDTNLPYDKYLQIDQGETVLADAYPHRVKHRTFMAADLDLLKGAIIEAKVVPITLMVGDWSKLPVKPTPTHGPHRVLAYGYEDLKKGTKVYFLNSWNEGWGKKGKGWFWWHEYQNYIFDIFAYVDAPNEAKVARETPYIFTKTLRLGSSGVEVRELQKRLKAEGDLAINELTQYFGVETYSALKKYQCRKDIVCSGTPETTGYGQLGPATRAVLNGGVKLGLYPKVASLRDQLIMIMNAIGHPIRVTSEYRSKEEQDALYTQGRTKPGPIVTNAKGGQSIHNYRCAFDVVFIKEAYEGPWNKLAGVAKTLGLEWGGDFPNFPDMPHFQYTAGYTLADFQKGDIDESRFAV